MKIKPDSISLEEPKKEKTVEITKEIEEIINKKNYEVEEAQRVLAYLKHQLNPESDYQIGDGISFIGLSKYGDYSYRYFKNGEERILVVDPEDFKKIEKIYSHAAQLDKNTNMKMKRLTMSLEMQSKVDASNSEDCKK